jgi:hypothetical protein
MELDFMIMLEAEVVASLFISTLLACLGALCLCTENFEGAVLAGVSLVFVAVFVLLRGIIKKRQIHKKLPKLEDVAFNPEKSINDTCPICLVIFELGENIHILPCRHSFHSCCIEAWLLRGRHCPQCRQFVYRTSSPVASN